MLKDKKALITGGSSGIGFATAKLMLEQGAQVAIAGRDSQALARAKAELGDGLLTFQVDVRSPAALQTLASEVEASLGALDIFFANAGIAIPTPLATATEAQYDSVMDANVKGVFFSVQAIAPIMRDGGSIILNTAWLNQVGAPGRAVLAASKAAVRSFTRTFSAELLERHIRVNAVSPGLIDTPILKRFGQAANPGQTDSEYQASIANAGDPIPLGRMGRAEEVAAAVLFLAGDGSSYMLGSEVVVDGGFAEL